MGTVRNFGLLRTKFKTRKVQVLNKKTFIRVTSITLRLMLLIYLFTVSNSALLLLHIAGAMLPKFKLVFSRKK